MDKNKQMNHIIYICIGLIVGIFVGYISSEDIDEPFMVGFASIISMIFWPIAIFFVVCFLVGGLFISIFNRN